MYMQYTYHVSLTLLALNSSGNTERGSISGPSARLLTLTVRAYFRSISSFRKFCGFHRHGSRISGECWRSGCVSSANPIYEGFFDGECDISVCLRCPLDANSRVLC